MMISQLNRKGLVTNSITKPNHNIQYEDKDAQVTRAGQGNSEEHESRINDDVQDDNNGEMRVVQALDENGSPKKKTRQGPHTHLVRWDKFLPFKSLKVLLVENDDSTRHVVSALLRNCGYEVKAVDNGKQAWNVLEDRTADIDLVLSEVAVPCLSGVGLLSKIMSKKIFKDIPVIMMSAHDSRSVVFKCLSKGAVDFLVKPIRKNELKNLWQHVWRKHQISSGASGSESGIWIEKSMKSRIGEDCDKNTGSNDEDDTKSIGLDFKSESDSGTQSSWTTRAVDIDSPQPMSPQNQFGDSPDRTCAPSGHPIEEPFGSNWANETTRRTGVGHDNDLDKIFMGKDLRIGIGNTPSLLPKNGGENNLTEKYSKLNSKKDDKHLEKQGLDLNNEHPREEDTPAVVDLLGVSSDGSNPHVESSPNNIVEGFSKDILTNTEIPFFEVMLKRPRDAQDNGTSAHDRNVLRHSDLSAFSRYNSASTANQAPTGNVGSCSPVDNSSDGAKTESTPNINSDSNGTPPNQPSNGSSNNNDMGSTTNDAFTKQVSFVDKPSTKNQPQALDGQPSLHPNIQGSSHSGSSNVVRATAEGTSSNRKINKSTSGSSHKPYGHKRSNAALNSRGKTSENGARKASIVNGTGYRGRSEEDESRFAQREAALKRFRQKRQERCFEKKVRYQSRKKLAEQRPRIRGQFIRKGMAMHQNNGNGIDYEPDPTTQ